MSTAGNRATWLAFVAFLLALAGPARALVVATDSDEAARAPVSGSGFEYVGRIAGTTGVYLGDGWVLTAAHVGAGELELAGAKHPAVAGSWAALRGDAGSPPDLGVYRVEPSPPLPRLAIAARPPRPGEELFLVGCGNGRGERFEWGGHTGFRWASPGVCRWGTNRVALGGLDLAGAGILTHAFATLFSEGEPREAQAALGDSGGAAFVRRGGAPVLAGILIAVVNLPGQPAQTSVFGNETQLADLSRYRAEILERTGLPGGQAKPGP